MGSPRFKTVEAHGFLVTDAWFSPFLRLPPHYQDRTCFTVMLEGAFDVQFTRITHAFKRRSGSTPDQFRRRMNGDR